MMIVLGFVFWAMALLTYGISLSAGELLAFPWVSIMMFAASGTALVATGIVMTRLNPRPAYAKYARTTSTSRGINAARL